jgi:hypothetical protein
VYVLVVGVEKVAVTNDEVENGVRVSIRLLGVSPKDVIDRSPVVKS